MLIDLVVFYIVVSLLVGYHAYLTADKELKEEFGKGKVRFAVMCFRWPIELAKLLVTKNYR